MFIELLQTITLIGKDESGLIDRVASHHTAYGIADELFHKNIPVPADGVTIASIITWCWNNTYLSLLEDGDFPCGNERFQFVLQSIDFDELAIQFFLVIFQLVEFSFPLFLKFFHKVLYAVGCCTKIVTSELVAMSDKWITLKVQ